MRSYLLNNFYHLVLLFTAAYVICFTVVLSARLHYSRLVRAFVGWLLSLFLWAARDSLMASLVPHLGEGALLRTAAVLSPLFMVNSLMTFHLLAELYNAFVTPEQRFGHQRQALTVQAGVLGLTYIVSLIDPHFLYAGVMTTRFSYSIAPGTGYMVFALMITLSVALPAGMLLLATFRQQQTQALIMALGILSAFALVLLANTAGYMLPFDHLPQLGILSLSFVAFVVFFALWKYGYPVSIGNVMDELRKAKKIGESLKGLLVSGYEEDAIFQNICDSAQEISESIYVFVALFGVDGDSYVVRGLSQASETLMDTVFGRLPLAPGTRREITPTSAFRRLLDSGKPHQCNSIHDFFGGRIDEEKARQLDRTAEIRQIVSYPILLHEKVQGAIVLFRREVAESLDIYGVFAIQCSLALLTSAHIRELEEKRKLEEMLHHSQKMDAIGQLAGGMAHDFNNMLAGISGYATIIKRSFARDNPRLGTYIDAIIAASDRSAELITKLLAFARKGKYQMIAVDVHKAVGDVVEILQRTIDKRIRIIRNLSADPHTVLGDPAQVENIFLNLAVNARDAMSHGGTLTFETRVESIASDHPLATTTGLQPGEYLLATVADTGGGMDEETLSHIFEPFYTTKEVGKGTGLGLASVYGSVRNHHGHIEVHSAPGTGTTFRIALPLLRGDRIPEATATKPAVNFKEGKGHILIIDDEMMIRELCREILSHHGYDVTTAAGPHEALVFYRDHYHEVDAVLLDMIMPQMSGPDCLEVLRHTNNQVKVVLMTGHDFTDKTSTIISNGISGFLQKPFKEAELLEILAETLC